MISELYLEPTEIFYGSNNFVSGQMRIASIRGNEYLETKENVQIDGSLLSGGFVLSALIKHRHLWMKSLLHDHHLGDEFHTYSLKWTNKSISVGVDGKIYANYRSSIKLQAEFNNITQSSKWNDNEPMSPFDKEFFISLGVGVGGMADFPDSCLSGILRTVKPWNNTSPNAELNFWRSRETWLPTWIGDSSVLQVDHVKVWAL